MTIVEGNMLSELNIYVFIIDSFILITIIIFIYCNWVVTRWQWLFYIYTKHEIGYC